MLINNKNHNTPSMRSPHPLPVFLQTHGLVFDIFIISNCMYVSFLTTCASRLIQEHSCHLDMIFYTDKGQKWQKTMICIEKMKNSGFFMVFDPDSWQL